MAAGGVQLAIWRTRWRARTLAGMRILLSAVRIVGALIFLGGLALAVPACIGTGGVGAGVAIGVAALGLLMTQVNRLA